MARRYHHAHVTGASGSVAVRMRSSLSAAAGPTTRLPVPLPDLTSVAIMSSFCFFVLRSVRESPWPMSVKASSYLVLVMAAAVGMMLR